MPNLFNADIFFSLQLLKLYISIPYQIMTLFERSTGISDHESAQCKHSFISSGDISVDISMDMSLGIADRCFGTWTVGPAVPSDLAVAQDRGECVAPAPGAVVFNGTVSSVDHSIEQGRSL